MFLTFLVPFVLFYCISTGRQKKWFIITKEVINVLFTPSFRSKMKMAIKTVR